MKKNMKNIIGTLVLMIVSLPAFAAEASQPDSAVAFARAFEHGCYAFAAALAIGLPALGGALAQGRAAGAALEGIARNPEASGKIFVPMILGLAMIESLVLFGLIMAFMLSSNI